jgi:hypothetical protein
METVQDYILKERQKQLTYNMPFLKVFGVRLKLFFPKVLLGFDVVAFDKWLQPAPTESTYDAVNRKFGQDGVDLIKALVA